jgi:hypothetical protein
MRVLGHCKYSIMPVQASMTDPSAMMVDSLRIPRDLAARSALYLKRGVKGFQASGLTEVSEWVGHHAGRSE